MRAEKKSGKSRYHENEYTRRPPDETWFLWSRQVVGLDLQDKFVLDHRVEKDGGGLEGQRSVSCFCFAEGQTRTE